MNYVLERVTTEFSSREDRIRLVSQVNGSDSMTIWITRRLLAMMLPTLLERVSSRAAGSSSTTPAVTALNDGPTAGYESLRQEFAQLAANEQLLPVAPVRPAHGSASILSTAVDFKVKNRTVILIFRDESDTMATLALEEVQLRQWLQMLHKCSEREASWLLPCWPAWLTGASFQKSPLGLPVH